MVLNRIVYSIILFLPFLLFWFIGKNISLQENHNVIFASIEYPPEKSMKNIDEEVNTIIPIIKQINGVTYVYTEARKGTCEVEIGYNKKYISRF